MTKTTTRRSRRRRRPRGTPWYRKFDDCWYATVQGEKHKLVDESGTRLKGLGCEEEAKKAVARLTLEMRPIPVATEWTVARCCDLYLDYLSNECTPEHYGMSKRFLDDFVAYCGALSIDELMKDHVRRWVAKHTQWKAGATQKGAISTVVAAINYCVKWDALKANPLSKYPKPEVNKRTDSFTAEDEQAIYANANEPFANFIKAGILTGCRSFCEMAHVTAEDVFEDEHGLTWRIRNGKRKRGKVSFREIPLLPEMETLCRTLMKEAPMGSGRPLLQTLRGVKWTRVNGVQHFCALKRKLGWNEDNKRRGFSCYTARHTFAHRILSGYYTGNPTTIETLAALMGNTIKVCQDHYAANWEVNHKAPLLAAMGKGQPRS